MTQLRRLAVATVAAVALLAALQPAAGDDKTGKGTSAAPEDIKFIQKAASGGIHEVKLGELAKERTADQEVRKYGERMVIDHSKAHKELMAVAQQMGVQVPDRMNAEHEREFNQLETLKGRMFDQAYIHHMVEDHKKCVAEVKTCSESAKDVRLRNFASKVLPVIKEHLTIAEQIESRITRK